MSSIDKLLIRGVRSFDPQGTNVIQFYSPLTIIVGHNGSGKTTVIECLKYATTGELPPGAKTGGAFIHDPKVAHETEVKAQVRLKFRNVNSKVMVCTRSLQLSQKAKKVEQKTLESILETKDPVTGERVSLSSRCSDLDAEMPIHLGVSKAVLENVIFCHQEESNWPLADPKTLKTKFDDIFASSRYTKALENIRSVKKGLETELREDSAWLQHRKEKKEKADTLRTQESTTVRRTKTLQDQITTQGNKVNDIAQQIGQLMKHVAHGENLENLLLMRGEQRNNTVQYMNELKANMVEFVQESNEQLVQSLDEHRKRLNAASGNQASLQTEEGQLEVQNRDFSDRARAMHEQKAVLAHQIKEYQVAVEQRKLQISDMSRKFEFDNIDTERPTQYHIQLFAQKMQSHVLSTKTRLEDIKRDITEQENTLLASLQKKQNDIVSVGLSKANAMQKTVANRRKREEYAASLAHNSARDEDVTSLQSQVEQAEQKLTQTRERLASIEASNQMQTLRSEMDAIDVSIATLNRELLSVNQDAGTRATLASRLSDKTIKETQLKRLINECESEMQILKLKIVPAAELHATITNTLRQKQDLLAARERQHAEMIRRQNEAETMLQLASSEMDRDSKASQDCESRLRTYCQDQPFEELVQEQEATIDACKMDIKGFESLGEVYTRFLSQIERTHKCALCTRDFESPESLQALINRITQVINMTPARKTESETRLRETTMRLNELKTYAAPLHSEVVRIQAQMPEIQRHITEAQIARSAAVDRVEEITHEIVSIKAEQSALSNLQAKTTEIARVTNECDRFDAEVARLNDELSIASTDTSMVDLQQQLEELQNKRTLNRQKTERHQATMQNIQSEVGMCQNRLHSVTQELGVRQAASQERHRLLKQVQELDQELLTLDQEVQSLDRQLKVLRDEEVQKKAEQASIKSTNDQRRQKVEMQLQEAQKMHDSFQTIHTKVIGYERDNIQMSYTTLETEIATVEEKITINSARAQEIRDHLVSLRLNLAEIQNLERNVNDNLMYRRKRQELCAIDDKINGLQQDLREYEGHSYTQQLRSLKQEQDRLVRESSRLQGELGQLLVNLQQIQEDLAGEYRNAEDDYKEMVIKVKTSELAAQDLEKYAKALDAALMKYHTLKMDEVNKIIREMWVNTYQGNDIDTIEIRSDKESTRGARQFQYRVVMIKGDIELDMRGRCSAGQKVLTSLIIRLALAETFCLNCGILALDEPTTNLDRENIESLAESLSSIIKMRRQQSNFQLIVITHDEEFMQLLGRSEFTDYYWRVFKDDSQHSIIERQAITEN